jgi:hypothetical protein
VVEDIEMPEWFEGPLEGNDRRRKSVAWQRVKGFIEAVLMAWR